jgi:hypothetical protein
MRTRNYIQIDGVSYTVVGREKVARLIVSKCLVDQSAQPESDGSIQRFSSNLQCTALTVVCESIAKIKIKQAPPTQY